MPFFLLSTLTNFIYAKVIPAVYAVQSDIEFELYILWLEKVVWFSFQLDSLVWKVRNIVNPKFSLFDLKALKCTVK